MYTKISQDGFDFDTVGSETVLDVYEDASLGLKLTDDFVSSIDGHIGGIETYSYAQNPGFQTPNFQAGGPDFTTIPGDVSTTATIAVNSQINSTIDVSGDTDWFSVTLEAGQTYDISMLGTGTSSPLSDPLLRLFDANGVELATNDDIILGDVTNSLLTFTVTTTGTYYVSAEAYANSSGTTVTGDYTLSLFETNGTSGDIAASTATTATAIVNGSVSGVLETTSDSDWFAITLVAGQRYSFASDGTGSDVLEDPFLTLYDANGNVVKSNDDSGPDLNAKMTFIAETSGVYYIGASSVNSDGQYAITVKELPTLVERTVDQVAHFLTDEYSARQAYGVTEITYNITGLEVGAQALAIRALQAWSDVTPLVFSAVTTGGMIVFSNDEDGAFNSNTTIGSVIQSSTVNVNATWQNGNVNVDSYTYQTFLHEIGHALGLGHAGPYNGEATYNVDNIYLNDSWAYSVMSYFDQNESGYFGDFRYVLGLQIADIVAIQDLYGANTTTRNGDTVYGFNSTETGANNVHNFANFNRAPSLSIYDTGGIDTLDFSGYSQNQQINLAAESFSNVNGIEGVISIARGVIIENAIGGSGADTITGNSVGNVLTGNGGNDILNGGGGIDYAAYSGSSISDYTITDNGNGTFTVAHNNGGADGTDTLRNIEFLRINGVDYTLTGAEAAVNYAGTSGADTYTGMGGDDTIHGANGNDILGGGDGDDTITGDAGADRLSGDAGADTLSGGTGNDVLIGGAGNDQLDGGSGLDYAVYSGSSLSEYTITNNGDGSYQVRHNNGGVDGVDTLTDIEYLLINGQYHNLSALAQIGPSGAVNVSDSVYTSPVLDTVLERGLLPLARQDWIADFLANTSYEDAPFTFPDDEDALGVDRGLDALLEDFLLDGLDVL
ncbi:MAG: hypothetical protein COA69_03880 [Robiginitomaculum sp.]|nr:MAG: hypothetical protein COA69_03880 [Robiginitomaculum sp.]